ncbi:MAG: TylF/MycF/NovP-related O-methyltransferase [Candidatus Acidiferrales bacterium]
MSFKTPVEQEVGKRIAEIFLGCPESIETKLENFTKYVRRQHLKRFLAMYEIFKLILPVKGSIVECGVFRGFSLMAWAKLSAILEPENLTRRIYGFDTFGGFPSLDEKDRTSRAEVELGDFATPNSYNELLELVREHDQDRFLGHIPKVELIRGAVVDTLPKFLAEHRHLLVSLLFLDMDLYEPTKAALSQLLPRMPKGSLLVFDELDNPIWPGETVALMESIGINRIRIQRLEWDPYIGYAVIE